MVLEWKLMWVYCLVCSAFYCTPDVGFYVTMNIAETVDRDNGDGSKSHAPNSTTDGQNGDGSKSHAPNLNQ